LAIAGPAGLVEIELARSKTSWNDYYENIAAAIREGVPPAVTAEAGRRTVRVIEAVRKSAEAGRTIPLEAR
jgi:predicted dehydrogenase